VVGRNEALQPVEGEKDVSKDVYDDTDFYQALLREVVDSTSGLSNGMPGTAGAYASFNQISRKKLANVDPKASKGRKLRYHVHEKLQNFMAPIPTLTWEKEQTDELFRGLLGGNGRQDMEMHGRDESDSIPQAAGQLRIF
jgi:protein AATF/BFR2